MTETPKRVVPERGHAHFQKFVVFFHENAAFWRVFVRCETKFKCIVNDLYTGVNIETDGYA